MSFILIMESKMHLMHFCFMCRKIVFNGKIKMLLFFLIGLLDVPNELQGTFNVLGDSY